MSTFDPTQHPRGNSATGHAGQFATKQQTGAEIGLDASTRQPSYESIRSAFASGDYVAGADAITALRTTPGEKAVGLLIADALQTHQQAFLANVAEPDGTTYGDRIPVNSGDALEQLGDAFERGDLPRANELERNLRAREPSVVVDEALEHAIRRGIDGDAPGEAQTRHIGAGIVRVGDREFRDPHLFPPQGPPTAMRLEFDRDISDAEAEQIAQLVGYQYRSTIAGDRLDKPVIRDTSRSLVIEADTSTSKVADRAQALENFQNGLAGTISSGSPLRTTNRAGAGTQGTRLIEGVGGIGVNLFWHEPEA